jgi:hypothetical protein
MRDSADILKRTGEDPSGEQIKNYEEACKRAEGKRYQIRHYKCTACFVRMDM